MSAKKQKSYALEVTLVVLALVIAFVTQTLIKSANPPEVSDIPSGDKTALKDALSQIDEDPSVIKQEDKVPKEYNKHLTDLATAPDWTQLDQYQHTITKEDFERELEEVYTINGKWKDWITATDESAMIRMSAADGKQLYELFFASEVKQERPPKFWRNRDELIVQDPLKPLLGLRIVIDPGHIGGKFSQIEERQFNYKETPPVKEGNLTLKVAKMLAKQLETLGAQVTFTREYLAPVNPNRPADYDRFAYAKISKTNIWATPVAIRRASNKLFYRAGEIRERAKHVNNDYRPDLVLCLHFNAGVKSEELIQDEHFHMILNGAYMDDEVAKDDQRFTMMQRILQRVHPEEARLSSYAADAFTANTGLKPYQYDPASNRALNVDKNPYLWARNLAANRSYLCPVLFYEPYLMNGVDSHARIIQGDYEGLRYLNGMLRPSIFREYVNAVTEGLVTYYSKRK
ncbi:MAG: N-acetylmuramoyl-L-alanine amidase [Cryomorphaceae bacterium]|jgi:N-acetylmuramoyl-L-alanine amidase